MEPEPVTAGFTQRTRREAPSRKWATLLMAAGVLTGSVTIAAEGEPFDLPGEAEVSCAAEGDGLRCHYRLLPPGQSVTAVAATLDGEAMEVDDITAYPGKDARSTILILMDTGTAGQRSQFEGRKRQIESMLQEAAPHQRFGLAAMDTELRLLELPIRDAENIIRALGRLEPSDQPTELYRTTLIAVRLLAKQPTDRKGIIIVSDGQADDTAYFPRDVIMAARAGDVVINSIGFAATPHDSTHLQSLRRLSDETGGDFVAADASGILPAPFLEAPFRAVDNGGTFRIRNPEDKRRAGTLNIRIETPERTYSHSAQVAVGARPAPVSAPESAPARRPPPRFEPETGPSLLDLALLGGFLALFGIVAYVLVRKIRAVPDNEATAKSKAPALEPGEPPLQGMLEYTLEPERTPILLSGVTFRLGRNADNDIRLQDNSVSRHHAQIHRGPDGAYVVSDLNSLNGVFVNGRQVQSSQLKEGDKLEIGDVALRFRVAPAGADGAPDGEDLTATRAGRSPFP